MNIRKKNKKRKEEEKKMKKWRKIGELTERIMEDSTLSTCAKDLKCLSYAPNIGYRSWIFKYKGELVALFDAGNGHYDFHTAVNYVDLLVAKLMLFGDCITEKLRRKV